MPAERARRVSAAPGSVAGDRPRRRVPPRPRRRAADCPAPGWPRARAGRRAAVGAAGAGGWGGGGGGQWGGGGGGEKLPAPALTNVGQRPHPSTAVSPTL